MVYYSEYSKQYMNYYSEFCCIIGQNDTLFEIELFPSIVLSSRVTNCKNDIHKFLQQFE